MWELEKKGFGRKGMVQENIKSEVMMEPGINR